MVSIPIRLAKVTSLATLAVCLLALVGCGAYSISSLGGSGTPAAMPGASVPPWQLQWVQPQNGILASRSPQDAFAQGARVYHDSQPVPLAAITLNWLATGPTFGVVLARLDPAATFQDVVLLYSTPHTGWVGNATTTRNGGACQSQDSQRQVNGLTFPQPVCSVGSLGKVPTSSQRWDFVLNSWYATSQTYLAFTSASAPIQRPPGASAISLAGEQGWQYRQGAVTVIALFTAPAHTHIFACLNDAMHCYELATQAFQ